MTETGVSAHPHASARCSQGNGPIWSGSAGRPVQMPVYSPRGDIAAYPHQCFLFADVKQCCVINWPHWCQFSRRGAGQQMQLIYRKSSIDKGCNICCKQARRCPWAWCSLAPDLAGIIQRCRRRSIALHLAIFATRLISVSDHPPQA